MTLLPSYPTSPRLTKQPTFRQLITHSKTNNTYKTTVVWICRLLIFLVTFHKNKKWNYIITKWFIVVPFLVTNSNTMRNIEILFSCTLINKTVQEAENWYFIFFICLYFTCTLQKASCWIHKDVYGGSYGTSESIINHSDIYSVNIPGEARLNGVTAEPVSKDQNPQVQM